MGSGHCGASAEVKEVKLTFLTSVDTELNIYESKVMALIAIDK
ncbi:hypothetical protein [Nostoc sp. C110]|jgi:hypothetical protein